VYLLVNLFIKLSMLLSSQGLAPHRAPSRPIASHRKFTDVLWERVPSRLRTTGLNSWIKDWQWGRSQVDNTMVLP